MSRSKGAKPPTSTGADVARRRVKQLRMQRGWTMQRLADELAALDPSTPFDRDVLANFETGRRRNITIDELLLFAAMFNEPVFALFVPMANEPPLRVGPHSVSPYDAYWWAVNESRADERAGSDEHDYFGQLIADGIPNLDTDDPISALEAVVDAADAVATNLKHLWRDLREREIGPLPEED